jgi:hypothetical protein
MKKFFVVFLLIVIIGACEQKEIKKSQQDEIIISEPGLNYESVVVQDFPIKICDRLQDVFIKNKTVLNKEHTLKIITILDELVPITRKMIHAAENNRKTLFKQATKIVQRNGFDDLEDYGNELLNVTWAAGTYLKMQKIEKLMNKNPDAKSVQFLTENLKRRLNKQPISIDDIELIRNNWEKIDEALSKMNELANEKMNS